MAWVKVARPNGNDILARARVLKKRLSFSATVCAEVEEAVKTDAGYTSGEMTLAKAIEWGLAFEDAGFGGVRVIE